MCIFAHNGHDHIKEIAQTAYNGLIFPIVTGAAVLVAAATSLVVFVKRKK